MGARQSKRSVDITTTPKKGDAETAPVSEDKIEKLGDADVEVVTNGTATHTDIEFADKDETKEAEEKPATEVKENGLIETSDGEKTPDKEDAAPAAGDQPAKTVETPAEKAAENGEKAAETPDTKKQKEKKKKKWSLRSISFSKKDKSKPSKEKEKNGEVEEVNEEKEEDTTTKATTETATNEDTTKSVVEDAQPLPTAEETIAKTEAVEVVIKEEPTPKDESEEVKVPPTPIEQPVAEVTIEKEKEEPVHTEVCVKAEKEDTVQEVVTPVTVTEEVKEVAVFAESLKNDSLLIESNITSPIAESLLEQNIEVNTTESENLIKTPIEDENSNPKEEPAIETSPDNDENCKNVESIETSQSETKLVSETPIESSEVLISQKNDELLEINEVSNDTGVEILSAGDSSPLLVESLSKPEDSTETIPSNDSVSLLENNMDTNINEQDTASRETDLESANIENHVFDTTEEKIALVTPAGDMPDPVSSQISLEPTDSLTSQETNLYCEEPSLDLSTIPETIESNEIAQLEPVPSSVCIENNTKNEVSDCQETESLSPIVQKEIEPLCNTDSIADLSTESLPSLPEPTDSVLEPMSLPPLDSVPDPLPDDNIPSESFDTKLIETEVALTNGNATNGMSTSPSGDDDDAPLPPSLDGPLKQVIAPESLVEEISQSKEVAETVESVQSEAQ